MCKKCRLELVDEPKHHPYRRVIHNDFAEQLVNSFMTHNINALKRSLKFNVIDVFNIKQKSITEKIKEILEDEDI